MEPKKYLKRETHKDNCKQYRVFHEIKEEEKHTTKKHEFIYTGKLKKKIFSKNVPFFNIYLPTEFSILSYNSSDNEHIGRAWIYVSLGAPLYP